MRIREGARIDLYYLLSDHRGSTALTVGETGLALGEMRYREASRSERSERRYKPWGEGRFVWGSTPSEYRYTGQRQDTDIGLYYYRARWYDPALGRFAQADTIVPGGGNPAAWDRYAYGLDNPVKYADPTGHSVECGMGEEYCTAGRLDAKRWANDLVRKHVSDIDRGTTLYFAGLTEQEKRVLFEAQMTEGDYNDALISGAPDARLWEDPLT